MSRYKVLSDWRLEEILKVPDDPMIKERLYEFFKEAFQSDLDDARGDGYSEGYEAGRSESERGDW